MLVAPFWTEIDIGIAGQLSYEVHSATASSTAIMNRVNQFISDHINTSFIGTWMLVAEWLDVTEFGGSTKLVSVRL